MGDFSFAGVLNLARHGKLRTGFSTSIAVDGFLGNCAGTLGYGGITIGNLGDDALSCRICTLGDGARMRGGYGFFTGTAGGVGGLGSRMVALNRSDSWRMARICSLPNERKGDAGAGCSSASASILTTSAALSVDEVVGMLMSCRKNSMVRTMRSARVFVAYILWHL